MALKLSRELKEKVSHGSRLFPMAGYLWHGGESAERVRVHWHPEIELIRLVKGRMQLQINLEEMTIEGPALVILPANLLHGLLLTEDCYQEALLFNAEAIALSSFDEVENEIVSSLATGALATGQIILPSESVFKELDALLENALRLIFDDHPSSRLKVKARVMEFLAVCYESGSLSRRILKSKTHVAEGQQRLKELLTYIDEHYAEALTVNAAAAKLGYSVPHFCKFFKKAVGMSFTAYVNDLRLRQAATALKAGEGEITDILMDCGFSSPTYFFRLFKEKYGLTPLKYRHKVQGSAA